MQQAEHGGEAGEELKANPDVTQDQHARDNHGEDGVADQLTAGDRAHALHAVHRHVRIFLGEGGDDGLAGCVFRLVIGKGPEADHRLILYGGSRAALDHRRVGDALGLEGRRHVRHVKLPAHIQGEERAA